MEIYQGHGKTVGSFAWVTIGYSKQHNPIRPDFNWQTIEMPQTCGII